MTVRASLHGEMIDLEILHRQLPLTDGAGVISDVIGHHITDPSFNDLFVDTVALHATASRLLTCYNGIARVADGNFRPLALSGKFFDESGSQCRIYVLDTALTRDQAMPITAVGGHVIEPPPLRGTGYRALLKSTPGVNEVFRLMGQQGELDWRTLYDVYELVEHYSAGMSGRNRWMTESKVRLFARSAQPHRHGYVKTRPPVHPMELMEARAVVRGLVESWLLGVVGASSLPDSIELTSAEESLMKSRASA